MMRANMMGTSLAMAPAFVLGQLCDEAVCGRPGTRCLSAAADVLRRPG
jgi:hypothetical protein